MENYAAMEACLCFTWALQGWTQANKILLGENKLTAMAISRRKNQQHLTAPRVGKDKLKAIPQNLMPKMGSEDLNPALGMGLLLYHQRWEGIDEVNIWRKDVKNIAAILHSS